MAWRPLLRKCIRLSIVRRDHLSFRISDCGRAGRLRLGKGTHPCSLCHYLTGNFRISRFGGKGDLNVLLALNPFEYNLTREDFRSGDLESSETSGTNETLAASWTIPVSEFVSLQVGADHFVRSDLTITNYQQSGEFFSDTVPLDGANRADSSLYAAMQTNRERPLSVMAGVRATRHTTDLVLDDNGISDITTSVSWQTGVNVRLSPGVYGFVNASRGFRFPSLSERYYTGLTGRKYVIANPDLKPESSSELDAGIRLNGDHAGCAIFAFHNRIRDMIERYRLPDQTYTHDNIYVGTIRGFEIEGFYSPVDWLEFGSAYTHYSGRSSDGTPLNDVPAHRLLVSSSLYLNRLTLTGTLERVSRKSDPGPAESSHQSYSRLDLRLSWFLSQGWQLYMKGQNLTNRDYYPNADPDVPPAMGRSLRIGLQVRFPMNR